MFGFEACFCKYTSTLRGFLRRLVAVTLIVFIALWITSIVVSQPDTVNVAPLQLEQNSQQEFDGKVIIVGAGPSGLFCGYTLKYLGVDNFEILEANPNHFGGRVRENDAFLDVPIDLGAEWIHVNPAILENLLLFEETAPMPETIEYTPQSYDGYSGGVLRNLNWLRFFYSEYKFRNTTWYSYLNQFVYPYVAANVRLGSAVQTINYTDTDTIKVSTSDGMVFEADYVVLAVPASILHDGDIQFIPPLPSWKLDALAKVRTAPGMKIWLEFDEQFYADMVLFGRIGVFLREDTMLYFNGVFRKLTNRNVVAQLLVGLNGYRVEMTDEEAISAALRDLDEMFDGAASKHFMNRSLVQNWSKEPFIKGAYATNYDDYYNDIQALAASVDNRLYFSGDSFTYHTSTVHGAAITGREAAESILINHRLLKTTDE
jgi:monoamine oxidase